MTKDMKPLIEKRKYEKPAMQVYELQHRQHLLAGSGGLGNPNNYPGGGDPLGF